VTVLDACAVIALFEDEPAAAEVVELLDAGAALTTLGVGEVFDQQIRHGASDEDELAADLAASGILDPIVVDEELGIRAGILRAAYYSRWRASLSLADCVAAAAAESLGIPLATSDGPLLDMSYKEGIQVHPLPNHTGGFSWKEPHD
jgi:predicted nucleic acid-binding protein